MTYSAVQARPAAGPGKARPSFFARYEAAIFKLLGVLCALALWEAAADLGWASSTSISSPHRVAAAAVAYLGSSGFLVDARVSGLEFLGGFSLAVVVGIALGFATAWFRRLDYFLDPLINFLYASPRIAFAPLLIVWFGIGIGSKVAIIFLMAVFPIVINTAFGARSVDRDLVALARSFNATDGQLLRTIVVPSSIPFIATGLRIAIGLAFIGVVVGEFVAATAGIGFSIQYAASNFDVDQVFVGIIIVGVAGVVMTEALRYLEARLGRWKA
jgi:NitT/TauT family transport system permease protein